jgi:hypothetical protein
MGPCFTSNADSQPWTSMLMSTGSSHQMWGIIGRQRTAPDLCIAAQILSLTVMDMVRGVRSANILQLYAALPSWQLWKLVSCPQLMCGPPYVWVDTLEFGYHCCKTW